MRPGFQKHIGLKTLVELIRSKSRISSLNEIFSEEFFKSVILQI